MLAGRGVVQGQSLSAIMSGESQIPLASTFLILDFKDFGWVLCVLSTCETKKNIYELGETFI